MPELGDKIGHVTLAEERHSVWPKGCIAGDHRNTESQGLPHRDRVTVNEGGPDDHVGRAEEGQAPVVRYLAQADRATGETQLVDERARPRSHLPAHQDDSQPRAERDELLNRPENDCQPPLRVLLTTGHRDQERTEISNEHAVRRSQLRFLHDAKVTRE